MDSTSIAIFEWAFRSGTELGSGLVIGLSVIAVLVITAKLSRTL